MIRVWIGERREGEGGLMLDGNEGRRGNLEEITGGGLRCGCAV